MAVTRTGIDYQKGADSVQPEADRSPPDSCIWNGSIPVRRKQKKRLAKASLFFGDPYRNRLSKRSRFRPAGIGQESTGLLYLEWFDSRVEKAKKETSQS